MQATVWSKEQCPYCEMAKQLLASKGVEYTEKKIGAGYTKEQLLEEVPAARSVPQIIVDGVLIGGFQELQKFLAESN